MELNDFLKTKKVRCVTGSSYNFVTAGKLYEVIGVSHGRIKIHNDEGGNSWYDMDWFELVIESVEIPPPVAEAKFKVGDPVYFPRLSNKLCVIGEGQEDDYVDEVNGSKALAEMQSDLDFVYEQKTKSWLWDEKDCAPQLLYATPENHALLSKLYPYIEFEQPPKPLTGSDLCRAMLDKGWKHVPCYVSVNGDESAVKEMNAQIVREINTSLQNKKVFMTGAVHWDYAVPFDPRTGEPLTEAVLDE